MTAVGRHTLGELAAAEPTTVVEPADPAATGRQPQPVLTAAAVQAVLAALVTLGWLHLDNAALAALATAIAAVVAAVTALLARSKVTPTASPRDDDGRPLTP